MNVLTVNLQASDAAERFTTSLRETGFAIVTHHGIPNDQVHQAYAAWKKFFNSPEKYQYLFDKKEQDGYFPVGQETAKGNAIADLKEFYHVYPNKRIPEALREITFKLRTSLFRLAQTLLVMLQAQLPQAIVAYFDRPLSDMVSDHKTLLRILHYPALQGTETPGAIRAQAHEDINLITLLPAASAQGLQVMDVRGNWYDVPCDLGSIAINTGDMIDTLTQGYLPATTHRVLNPHGAAAREARMSLPLFLHPAPDVLLAPGRTAADFLQQRLQELGLL